MDRRNIWAGMKELCGAAQVAETKVFPHNLRHLFARCYYEQKKDLVRLADFLGTQQCGNNQALYHGQQQRGLPEAIGTGTCA